MGNFTRNNKPSSVGSIYYNVPRDADKSTIKGVKAAVNYLKENNVRLSISMKRTGGEGYSKYTGFFNSFKRDSTDPDCIIRDSIPAKKRPDDDDEDTNFKFGKNKKKAKPEVDEDETKEETEEEDTDEEEDGDDDEEDNGIPKFG